MKLEIRNLSKTYPNGQKALKNLNLDIPMGMFGLLGANGAGKSSLMRTLATLQEADSGTITFGDINVLKDKTRMRQILGYLPQDFGVYPGVSAEQLLTHLAALKGITSVRDWAQPSARGDRKDLVKHLLHQVNLYSVRHKAVSGYSGGMRQRFGIAQALIGNPKLIIVDEPTTGLDPAERVRFLNLLSQVGENAAIILSTHIVEDVAELCSNMAIIDKGQVRLTGNPLELMGRLKGKIWEKTLKRDELPACQQTYQVISTRFFVGNIIARIFDNRLPDASCISVSPTLEDVYFCTQKQLINNSCYAA